MGFCFFCSLFKCVFVCERKTAGDILVLLSPADAGEEWLRAFICCFVPQIIVLLHRSLFLIFCQRKLFANRRWWFFFFSPSTGVVAVSDPRGPAADPPGPGLGASRGGALCGAGGLLTQQVGGLTPSQSCHHWNTFIALFTAYWLFLYLSLTSHLFISLSFAWVSLFYASSFDSALKNTRWPLLNFFSLF